MSRKSFLQDEQGNWSMARSCLLGSLVLTFLLIYLDAATGLDAPTAAYALLGTIFTGLLAWTAGPRIAQYVGPQIAGLASGIASAAEKVRSTFSDDDDGRAARPQTDIEP